METKNHIFQTAMELIATKGYEEIKIGEICRQAGVSVGAFYHYFPSKNDLLIEMYSLADLFFAEQVRDRLENLDFYHKIVEFFTIYAQYNEKTGVSVVKQLYHVENRLLIQKGRGMQQALTKIIEAGQAAGKICTDIPADEITEYLFIAARGVIYYWCLHDGGYDLQGFMRGYMGRLVKIFLK
ncbi:TetR/AcrR family transcriptional regulator [Weizmannia acidilactici]|uniref:TetR/AcrR family transcriptional regulator n=1 Tax=Weizmannia acidilactici TaxID=2607726 RepID=UPI00280BBFDE|nr:TetR/AcrR family transcriptional regulator [Weizmannia acidilactici]